jgi:hypothetical protein
MDETSLLDYWTGRKSPVCKSKTANAYYGISTLAFTAAEGRAQLDMGTHLLSEDMVKSDNAVHHLDSRWLASTV